MASDVAIAAEEIIKTRGRLNKLYANHTGRELSEIEKVMDRDFYMDCDEAIEFGVIDSILHKRSPPSSAEE
jgi:ATP-dependent Clp protease protease subunit